MSIPVPSREITAAVQTALAEDLALSDVTTSALFPEARPARGVIIAHEAILVAGIAVARQVFTAVDPAIHILRSVPDGRSARKGQPVLTGAGDARSLFMGERVALNFLQRLSGIASLTARYCDAVRGYPTRILDTRKTTPGLRALEKWAVRLGGGSNHRHTLGDGLLIKDNHLAVLRGRGMGLAGACRLARERGPHGLRLIVEVQSADQAREAIEGGADIILLDNMTPAQVRDAVTLIKGRALVEVSGGITLQTVQEMAASGANFISIGALTHSAPAANLSMDILPLRGKRASSP